jgi:hypothetical protein
VVGNISHLLSSSIPRRLNVQEHGEEILAIAGRESDFSARAEAKSYEKNAYQV